MPTPENSVFVDQISSLVRKADKLDGNQRVKFYAFNLGIAKELDLGVETAKERLALKTKLFQEELSQSRAERVNSVDPVVATENSPRNLLLDTLTLVLLEEIASSDNPDEFIKYIRKFCRAQAAVVSEIANKRPALTIPEPERPAMVQLRKRDSEPAYT